MTEAELTLLGVIVALVAGGFGYWVNIWISGTSENVKETEQENQQQGKDIIRLQEQIKTMQEKLNKIETNDLEHLRLAMIKNASEHQNIMLILTEVATKMGIEKKW